MSVRVFTSEFAFFIPCKQPVEAFNLDSILRLLLNGRFSVTSQLEVALGIVVLSNRVLFVIALFVRRRVSVFHRRRFLLRGVSEVRQLALVCRMRLVISR